MDDASRAWFESLLPDGPGISSRPMFGNRAGFVNGNMFLALLGQDVAVRLPEEDREELLREEGAAPFEPAKGRPMKEYVVLPAGWRRTPAKARAWVERSLEWVASMPPKSVAARKKR